MSKNITIKEGQTSKDFGNVKKIQIHNQGGGSSYWVPEDETTLGTKHITKNGTYKASEEKDSQGQNAGYYGYSQVTVSGIGVASGIDPETGEDAADTTDPNTNEIQRNYLPKYIGLIAQPIKRAYHDGEKINMGGATIQAYMKDGTTAPWEGDSTHPNGIVPLTEITVNPDTAHFSGQLDGEVYKKNGVEALGIYCNKYSAAAYVGGYHSEKPTGHDTFDYLFLSRTEEGYIYYTRYQGRIYGIHGYASAHAYFTRDATGDTGYGSNPSYSGSGMTFQYMASTDENNVVFSDIKDQIPVSEVNPIGVDFTDPEIVYETQTINVNWRRPIDGKQLTTSFKIGVVADDNEEENED